MIQVNFPISGTMTFVIYAIGVFACKLNGYFLAMVNGIKNDEWLKKGGCKSPLPTISTKPKTELEKKIIVAEIKRNKQKIRLSALQLKMGQLLALYPKISEYEMAYFAWGLEDM
jgi:hypothetical protein